MQRFYAIHITSSRQAIKNSASCNFYAVENSTKDRTLKAINRISSIKSSAKDIKDLMTLICKILDEDFNAKFWIVSKDGNSSLMSVRICQDKIEEVFKKMQPEVIHESGKTIYFTPLFVVDKNVAVLITEVCDGDRTGLSLGRILPVLAKQIGILIDNFEIDTRLTKSKMNEESERLRSLILSSISHDLKTPLFAIIGSLNILKILSYKNKLSKKNKKTLIMTALEEAERLNGFISDVLEMTRIESGAIRIHKRSLSPAIEVPRILKRFEKKLEEFQVEISLTTKIKIHFDLISFEQIIQNLIDNTIKFAPKNTHILIHDEILEHSYRIFIKDEGRGLDPTKLEQIFNKFERFSLGDKTLGSGLGLSIVKALMECNNAKVSAQNCNGKTGAIFILEFKDFSKKAHL